MSAYSIGFLIGTGLTRLRKVRFTGRENLLYDEPTVVIANHTHWADPILIGLAYKKRKVRFMAKAELFAGRMANFWLHRLGSFPIARDTNDIKALKTALQVMKDGDVLGIFPEGTREGGGEYLVEFKQGAVSLAMKGKAAIIPIAISDAENFLRFGSKSPRVLIGKPIRPTTQGFENKQCALDYWTEQCQNTLAEMLSIPVQTA